jgi:hypothetical protein
MRPPKTADGAFDFVAVIDAVICAVDGLATVMTIA